MIKNHIKTAWRNMMFHRMTSFINLAGLTIGMTAAFLIFMWVKNEFSYDTYHHGTENIYRLTTFSKKDGSKMDERTPHILGEDLKKQLPEAQAIARIYPISIFSPTIKVGQSLFKEKAAAYVDENWFKVFSFDFIGGNATAFNDSQNSVVLSASASKKYFGNQDPVGKVLKVNDADCIIQGVVKDYPANSSFRYDLFISNNVRPVNTNNRTRYGSWAYSYQTFIKLPVPVNTAILAKINAVPDEDWKSDRAIGLVALKDIHFESDLKFSVIPHGDKKITNILLLLGGLLLVIACINYVNLTTAKATSRIKEVSVKKIIGAERKQLFLQFVIESALVGIMALLATLLLVRLSLPLFIQFTDNHFTLSLTDSSLWQLLIGTLLVTLALNSIYPALLLSSFKPIALLRGNNSGKLKGGQLRKSLVVVQFAISVTLVIGTIVIYQQMQFINKEYENYDKTQVFSFMFPSELENDDKKMQMETVLQRLLTHTSIQNVAITATTDIINVQNIWGGFDWDGRDENIQHEITFMPSGLNFNELIKLQIKQGRWFIPHRKDDEKNFVLNETAVRELGIHQPIVGQRFTLEKDTGVIVGVVKDFHYLDVRKKIGPVALGNNSSYNNSFMVKSMPGKQAEALKATETVWKQFVPNEPFDYKFASDEFDRLYRTDRKTSTLILSFSLLAVFVSCLGLYGLATFSAERRNKEIGIRKVLGASVARITQMLSVDFIKLVLVALVIAFPVAWWAMSKWLQSFAYRIDISWWVFALAAILAVLIAFVTVSSQAIKAALANPVKSLRSE
jgi:putative ABC transport system permease protein